MTQLYCNGLWLDLYDDAGLQFTHANPLFAFDDLECERTTQFNLPRTRTNDTAFSLARIPAYDGEGMRRKFYARLISGVLVKEGYLYVDSFDGTDYSVIFVTGEFVKLQALKDKGNVRDTLQYDSTFAWVNGSKKNANRNDLQDIDYVNGAYTPSVNLLWLMRELATAGGFTLDETNLTDIANERLFFAGNELELSDTQIHLQNVPDPDLQDGDIQLTTFLGLCTKVTKRCYSYRVTAVNDEHGRPYWSWIGAIVLGTYYYDYLTLPYDCVIEFPMDFPDDYALCKYDIDPRYWDDSQHSPNIWLGTRGISSVGTAFGVPLAGTKVTIPANTPFCLLRAGIMHYNAPASAGDTLDWYYKTWELGDYDFKVKISIDHAFVEGENVPYNAILPDCEAIDILKMGAYLSGTLLNVDADNIYYETLANWGNRLEIRDLLEMSEVRRVFADYARNNYVRFREDAVVTPSQRLTTNYMVDNDLLEESKDLAEMVASEGEANQVRDTEGLVVRNAPVGTATTSMIRVVLPKNEALQSICWASTQVKVRAHMNLLKYNDIMPASVLLMNGSLYVWTERSWQDDEAEFTLARLV